jgi:hypothetical protein
MPSYLISLDEQLEVAKSHLKEADRYISDALIHLPKQKHNEDTIYQLSQAIITIRNLVDKL